MLNILEDGKTYKCPTVNLHRFANHELRETYPAFEQVVLLCEVLPTTAKEKLKDEILSQKPPEAASIGNHLKLMIENKNLHSTNE